MHSVFGIGIPLDTLDEANDRRQGGEENPADPIPREIARGVGVAPASSVDTPNIIEVAQ